MRPPLVVGVGALVIASVLVAIVVEGAAPPASRPPQEASSRPALPPHTEMPTPHTPAAPFPRDVGSWGAPERALVLLGALAADPTAVYDRPPLDPLEVASSPVSEPTQRPAPRPRWHRDPEASWYGPGFYGRRTACGLAMTRTLVGVAHRSLPCGTLVVFRHAGRTVTAPVVDRGPYVDGRRWDLTAALAIALDHLYTGPLEWRLE